MTVPFLNKPLLFLAPLAGYSDSAFRQICKNWGAEVLYSEMISADGLTRNSAKTLQYAQFDESEHPFGIQIFGSNPLIMAKAVEVLLPLKPDFMDINMGCPVKKVIPNLSEAHRPDVGGSGTLMIAARGQGAWWQPLDNGGELQPLRVSETADTARMRILRSFETGHTNVGRIERMAAAVGVTAAPVRMDSQAKYAVLASGHAELLLRLLTQKQPDYRERIWDQAAGALITEEAGGRITDLDGKKLDFSAGRTLANNRGVCASNGHVHEVVLETLREVCAG